MVKGKPSSQQEPSALPAWVVLGPMYNPPPKFQTVLCKDRSPYFLMAFSWIDHGTLKRTSDNKGKKKKAKPVIKI